MSRHADRPPICNITAMQNPHRRLFLGRSFSAAKVAADVGGGKGGESNAVNAAIARAATPKPLKTTAAEQQ